MSEHGPPPVPGARSDEERERARRQREAQRAGRDGDSLYVPERPVRPRGPRPHPPRRVMARRIAALLVLAAVIAAAWFFISLFQPFTGNGSGSLAVSIPTGANVGEIGDILSKRGVVSSSFFFELRARLDGRSGDLKPGVYHLRRGMSYAAALDALTKGVPPNVVQITIPEGRSRNEVAPLTRGLKGSYAKETIRSPYLNPRSYGARHARNLEGFLFPASYQLKKGASVRTLVKDQLQAFKQNFAKVPMRYARSKNLSRYDVLIIASMVEREASVPRDRPLIASVIYNRLHDHMPLGIDSTLRFALNDWTHPLRLSQLASSSPYNTRNHVGLPPGPIG
ncbi:MAG TPA: endolytic transglycosylase MltG, partial [Thermoleophilaceae bacterium]|nr:endolytic transglycosylase MltG [Thermoleophilaceae bacterium]